MLDHTRVDENGKHECFRSLEQRFPSLHGIQGPNNCILSNIINPQIATPLCWNLKLWYYCARATPFTNYSGGKPVLGLSDADKY